MRLVLVALLTLGWRAGSLHKRPGSSSEGPAPSPRHTWHGLVNDGTVVDKDRTALPSVQTAAYGFLVHCPAERDTDPSGRRPGMLCVGRAWPRRTWSRCVSNPFQQDWCDFLPWHSGDDRSDKWAN